MLKKIMFLAVLLALAGCALPSTTSERAKSLRVGMTKAEVLEVMGEPLAENFCTPDLWYYYVETIWVDGLITEDECMPLVFENGTLKGFGKLFYSQYRMRKDDLPEIDVAGGSLN